MLAFAIHWYILKKNTMIKHDTSEQALRENIQVIHIQNVFSLKPFFYELILYKKKKK